jgi:hypothetical protein
MLMWCQFVVWMIFIHVHRKKKVRKFPVPRRDVTTKPSLGGNNDVIAELFLPRGSLVSDIPAGDGKLVNLFLRCTLSRALKKMLQVGSPEFPQSPVPSSCCSRGTID